MLNGKCVLKLEMKIQNQYLRFHSEKVKKERNKEKKMKKKRIIRAISNKMRNNKRAKINEHRKLSKYMKQKVIF